MMRKLIGIITAVAVVAILVITVLHRHNFHSMVLQPTTPREAPAAASTSVVEVIATDTVAIDAANSLR